MRKRQHLLQGKALPRGSELWVGPDLAPRAETQECMEKAAVAHIHLRRLILPLRDILEPWRKLPHQVRPCKHVEIVPHGAFVHAQRPSYLRAIPDLTVVMRKHHPEAPERLGGDPDTKLGHVALQEGSHKGLAPAEAERLALREERSWEATTEPKLSYVTHPNLY